MKLPKEMSIRSYRHQIPIIFNMDPANNGFNKPLKEEQLRELLRRNEFYLDVDKQICELLRSTVYKDDKVYYDDEVLDKLYKKAVNTGSHKDLKAYLEARRERL